MRPHGRRKKKLIVAFQFQFANQAAWKCDTCRAQGLEKRRRCGWLPKHELPPERTIWAGRTVRTTQCPQSLITADSIGWLEQHHVARMFGFGDVLALPARTVEAFSVIETELAAEKRNGIE